ncbi:MFS transporter [Isoptericola dokdonensis]|uniref:Inner membrane protein YbjJ n=1 Tax=Isoptericola dokdonensis DS-3 TaxID=1300344 RepID=A0A161I1M2_9MICO|nr:MFS transporter [Isoptericola dokdonensis]ANC31215.1 Inner membrane protein YbjJ [Isoptericola dokdonensis DS-3]
MNTTEPGLDARRLRAATWAVFGVFIAAGFGMATWASRIPAVRDGLGYSEGQMGLLLLTASIGSICALPLSGMISSRLGAARTVLAFAVISSVGFAVACFGVDAGEHVWVRVGLFLAGIGVGVWDAAMNLEGAVVEQRLGRAIMPRFHAAFSLGTVAGAGVGALAAWAQVPLTPHLLTVQVVDAVAVLLCVRAFLPARDAGPQTSIAGAQDAVADPATAVEPSHGHSLKDTLATWREPRTLLIGLVVMAAALTEGAANDWVGLATVDGFETGDGIGALALAVFLVAMTVTRLGGTALIDRYGRVLVLRVSGVAAIVGVTTFALVPNLPVALVGVALWGAGAGLGFPMGMSAASDDPQRAALRVAVVSTIGYSAFFVGPALIGFLAEVTGYRLALLVLALPVAVGILVAGAARPLPQTQTR